MSWRNITYSTPDPDFAAKWREESLREELVAIDPRCGRCLKRCKYSELTGLSNCCGWAPKEQELRDSFPESFEVWKCTQCQQECDAVKGEFMVTMIVSDCCAAFAYRCDGEEE